MKNIYWKSREYKYVKKNIDWYWILWSLTAFFTFIIYHFFKDNIFAFLILSLSVIITLASFKRPAIKKYSLNSDSIFMESDRKNILFSNIKSYNIDFYNMKILINTKNKIQPLIHIPFESNQNIEKIDIFLSKIIKKDEELKIPFLELLLTKILGF